MANTAIVQHGFATSHRYVVILVSTGLTRQNGEYDLRTQTEKSQARLAHFSS